MRELDCEEGWVPKNWCFWTVVLEKTLESPLDCKEIQPVHSEGDQPRISLEGMMLKLKLQYFGHLMQRVDSLEKDSDAGRDWGQEEKGMTEDGMAGWHHCLDGRESQWTPGAGDGQGGLACCDSWGHKELDTTERLIWSDLIQYSCLGNTMSRGTWLAIVHGVTKSWIQLSEWTHSLEKRMKKQLLPLCWWRNKQFCTGQRYQNSDPRTVRVSDDLSKSCVCLLVAASCPTLRDHMDWSSPRTKSVSRTRQEQRESLSLQFKARGPNSPWEKSVMK